MRGLGGPIRPAVAFLIARTASVGTGASAEESLAHQVEARKRQHVDYEGALQRKRVGEGKNIMEQQDAGEDQRGEEKRHKKPAQRQRRGKKRAVSDCQRALGKRTTLAS